MKSKTNPNGIVDFKIKGVYCPEGYWHRVTAILDDGNISAPIRKIDINKKALRANLLFKYIDYY